MTKTDEATKKARQFTDDDWAEAILGEKLYREMKAREIAIKVVTKIIKRYHEGKLFVEPITKFFRKYILLVDWRAERQRQNKLERRKRLMEVKKAVDKELCLVDKMPEELKTGEKLP